MVAFTAASVLTATALNSAFNAKTINAQSGTTYTFVLTDHGSLVTANNASASTYTLSSATAFAVGDQIEVLNIGAGVVTLAGSGVTINGTLTIPQNGRVLLVKQAATVWWSNPLGGGGLVLLNTTTLSAAASVSVNNCFSSAYDNYRILLESVGSASLQIRMKMRAAGVDDSSANYNYQNLTAGATTVTAAKSTGQVSAFLASTFTSRSAASVDVFSPAIARATTYHANSLFDVSGGASMELDLVYGGHNVATAYDGYSLIASTGTITGTVRTYAYSN